MPTPPETFHRAKTHAAALDQASLLVGVQPEFWDIWGRRHITSPEVQGSVLKSVGLPIENVDQLNDALEQRLWREWTALLPPTTVIGIADSSVEIRVPERLRDAELSGELLHEDGEVAPLRFAASELETRRRAVLRDEAFVSLRLPLPAGTPLGYHKLHLRVANLEATARVILCPERAYLPEFIERGGCAAGIAVSLYGLRSTRNWGCGDFTDLMEFTNWVATDLGASFIGLNPLHAIANRQPYNTSPYLPTCTYYRNPLYLDIERIQDFRNCDWARRLLRCPQNQSKIAELRRSKYVEYEKVWSIKLRFLKLAFRQFLGEYRDRTARARQFDNYIAAEGELLNDFAIYCALDEVLHKQNRDLWIWPEWPQPYRERDLQAVAAFAAEHWRLVLFYKYIQWQVDLQLEEAQRHACQKGLSIGLYHDLALATDRCGSDLWANGAFYVAGCRVGAPPDSFSPKGQDWAFPPPDSEKHKADGYELFAQSIRKNLKHGGALRLDHVMRFFRLYWIPDGKDATEGAYVRDVPDDLLRILALESVRNRVIIVGEDLGTVEPEVRDSLKRFGVLSYRLLYFERHENGSFKGPSEYPKQALVSVSTHDLATLTGFWTGRDIEARRRAGLLGNEENYREQMSARDRDKQHMIDVFVRLGLLPPEHPRLAILVPEFTGELHNAAIGFLASTRSMLMVLNQEDLFKDEEQQNLPGSTAEYPNWRHKMRFALDELRSDPLARDCTTMFRNWLERTGRLNVQRNAD